ncbi:MAG: NAD(P)/FAD-dependent oxidoreductase [Gammaproteobacteria bacterium]|nr:NAD(P)/FAD-dependent oxidoreductase [Gammaproteobacteria bacterium]
MSNYDVVVVGSGHNGLVAAGYLAAAGKKVLVVERNAWFGGGVVTRELTLPGYLHDQHSMAHIFIQGNPLLKNDELKLKSKYGLRYVFPESPMTSYFADGSTLTMYRDREKTCAEIAKFSQHDADAFRRLAEQAAQWLPMVASTLYAPPAPMGATTAMMDQSREGRMLWKTTQMSTHDLLCHVFENDRVRMHFGRIAGENLVSPDEKATGMGVFVFTAFLEAYGFGVAIGGSGALTNALIACIRDHGGEVIADVDVREVKVRNGRACGVVDSHGKEYDAREAVIGAFHPHVLGKIVPGLDPVVAGDAAGTEISPVGCITVHAALSEPLKDRNGSPVRSVMNELLPDDYETMRRSFDDLRYGNFAQYPLIGLGSLSAFDDSRVPAGAATMHAWDYVNYERKDGKSWDDTKHEYADVMLKQIQKYFPNVTDATVKAYHCDTPVDMERTSPSFLRGDLHGIATTTYQSGAHRPTPELGQCTVPGVDRLYLVGPFQHPGGGVFGAGRIAAMKACEAMKIDFEKLSRN